MVILRWPEKRHYNSGELAPVSGIYIVTHIVHRAPHEVVAVEGEELPPCRTCKNEVSYQVLHPISYVAHDWDLAGLTGLAQRAS